MAAGGLGIYGAASAPEQFRKHLSFIKNFFTTSSSSPTTDLIALFTTTPTPTLLKPSSFQKQLQILAPEEVEARLAQNQQLFRVVPNHSRDKQRKEYENLTLGYSIKRVASNNPIEDILSRHVPVRQIPARRPTPGHGDGRPLRQTDFRGIDSAGERSVGRQDGQGANNLDWDEIKRAKQKLKAITAAITCNKENQQGGEEELTPADLAPKGPASQIRLEGVDGLGVSILPIPIRLVYRLQCLKTFVVPIQD
ncbi:MAG: hypothetical protein BYD32DRAFT_472944 [Podila humilis]|nr:MAG: hypothetical protein BYD32DRAFT_472944 [Podila humilis]